MMFSKRGVGIFFVTMSLVFAGSILGAAERVYWTDSATKKIQRAHLDGTNVEDVITGLGAPIGIAVDSTNGKIYWVDNGTKKIQRSDLNGTNIQDLVISGLLGPQGIALDVAGGKMYWTDAGADKIQRANLDGSNPENLVTSGLEGPQGFALDVSSGKMYWTDWSKIQRANLDGLNVEDLLTGLGGLIGFSLDLPANKMYWVDAVSQRIQRANLNGTSVETLVGSGLIGPQYIAVGGGKIYWADLITDRIQRANLDGSGIENIVTGLTNPTGVALEIAAPSFTFTKIVDNSTPPIPGQVGTFATLTTAPAIDDGTITFAGSSGVFAHANGALMTVANTNTPLPEGQGNFTSFAQSDTSVDDGNVAFLGLGSSGQSGIYLRIGGSLSVAVDANTPIPGGFGNFVTFNHPIVSGSQVIFSGTGANGERGVYLKSGSTLNVLADINTPIPGGTGNFTGLGSPHVSGNNFVFQGEGGFGQAGIYANLGGSLGVVANRNTAIPGGSDTFAALSRPSISGETIAFIGTRGTQHGIYVKVGNTLSVVVDRNTPIPNGIGNFTLFIGNGIGASLHNGQIAFHGSGSNGQQGVYLWTGGSIRKVIDLNDTLDGKSITFLTLSRASQGLSGNSIVFLADFTDGTRGIYAAKRESPNAAPTANAGVDRAVRAGDTVTLNGSGSFDDNTPTESLNYAWSFIGKPIGSNAILSASTSVFPSFVVDTPGTYTVQLIVIDEGGLPSSPDQVVLSSDNLAPTANAGDDGLVVVGDSVTLDGRNSTDPEFDPIGFSWTLTSRPQASTAMLNNSTTPTPSFVPDMPGTYVVSLVVSDALGPSLPDPVSVTAATPQDYAEVQIQDTNTIVITLPPTTVTTVGNQNALSNFLSQAIVALQAGDLVTAQAKLQQAIERTDGCVLRGAPDGNGPGRDWITDCEAQVPTYGLLSDALDAITP